jgi:hypothetical protein
MPSSEFRVQSSDDRGRMSARAFAWFPVICAINPSPKSRFSAIGGQRIPVDNFRDREVRCNDVTFFNLSSFPVFLIGRWTFSVGRLLRCSVLCLVTSAVRLRFMHGYPS